MSASPGRRYRGAGPLLLPLGVPELVEGEGGGAGVAEADGAVRVASAGQALDGDVDEGAAQDRQFLPSGEPAAVAVDEGVDAVPGLGADGAVERGTGQGELLVGFGVRGQGLLPAPRPVPGVRGEARGLQAVHRGPAAGGTAVPALPGDGGGGDNAAGGRPDQDVDRASRRAGREGGR